MPQTGRFCPGCGAANLRPPSAGAPAQASGQETQLIGQTDSPAGPQQDATDKRKRCPQCGFPASGVTCEGCGANLSYARLLTPEEWAAKTDAASQAATVSRVAPDVIVATTNELPGYQILEVYGEVFGLTARARNYFANLTANVRTVVGGEVRSYTNLLVDSREEAVARLREAAAERGANAVLAMRFDANEFGGVISEIVAYGTAARVEPL